MVGSDHDDSVWEWVTASSSSSPSRVKFERVVLEVAPQATKAALGINKLLEQLPMNLAGRIASVRFVEKLEGNNVRARVFAVTYDDRRVLEFDNIDTFPTDMDIARIALECP